MINDHWEQNNVRMDVLNQLSSGKIVSELWLNA